jgi:proteic killer suppression protein
MIKNFRRNGIKALNFFGDKSGAETNNADRILVLLDSLETARSPKDMDFSPANKLHELKGDREGTRSVNLRENWCITFHFEGKDAVDVNYEDYH